ncbi:MAG: LCP family protein [Lachnospiraceae bacterium]|nr:LCP family protein [Lachnospiraceae bacterium]
MGNTGKKGTNKNVSSKKRKDDKVKKTIRIVGYFLCTIQLILSILATIYVIKLKIVPTPYIVVIDILLFVLFVLFVMLQKWSIPGIIASFTSIIVSFFLFAGCFYINFTYNKIKNISGVDTKVDNVNVYVRIDDPANDINGAANYNFGILSTLDRDNTNKIKADIESVLGQPISVTEYDTAIDLIKGLFDNQTQAIILNDAYMSFITDSEGYEDAENRIKVIYNKNFETSIKKDINEDYLNSEDDKVFTILINGVDTRGRTITNSNSDTNILLTVNMNTHQILMISTPRDYFVPLSISGNVRDKLTHSGAYGVDVTMDTLEMLYGVNVDDFVRINFDGFMDVIDALGGITVYSEYEFDGFDNDVVNMTYHFNQGYNDVNGKQALLFARERHAFLDGDRQRGRNQMAVIEGMIDKALSPQILKNYTNIWNEVSDCVLTSMDYDEIAEFVKIQLADSPSWEVVKYSVTGSDAMSTTYSTGSAEVYVMIPDETTVNQAKEYLRQIYAGERVVIPEQ